MWKHVKCSVSVLKNTPYFGAPGTSFVNRLRNFQNISRGEHTFYVTLREREKNSISV